MGDEFAKDILKLTNILLDERPDHRVIAIVSAAYIETHLVNLISEYFPAMTPTLKKAFFDETNGMVRAYGNRLDMAKALNAITPGAYHDAKLIGRIRNKFAHNLDVDSFEHEKVRDLVDALDKDGKLEQSYAVGATTDEIIEWGRTEKFIKIALGVCMQILHLHIKEYPFSFSNGPHAIGTGAKPPLLDTLNKPPHRGK